MLGRFVRSPRTVGAVMPSSRALARAMVAHLDLSGDASVVELGPGTGVFTRELAQRLGPQARALAVEIEPSFVAALQNRFPRVEVVCASAEQLTDLLEVRGMLPVDHIISGLPFASLPSSVTTGILTAVVGSLRPGGTFTTFQYLNGYPTPLAGAFRRDMTMRMGEPPARRVVWRNVPPALGVDVAPPVISGVATGAASVPGVEHALMVRVYRQTVFGLRRGVWADRAGRTSTCGRDHGRHPWTAGAGGRRRHRAEFVALPTGDRRDRDRCVIADA